jgi:small multidrug resistance family-3 protein
MGWIHEMSKKDNYTMSGESPVGLYTFTEIIIMYVTAQTRVSLGLRKVRIILITLIFFLLAGLCEIGGGYLVWLWLREDMSWILGAIGGFILFLYGIVPTFQPSYFHRIYAAYGGIFIVMALLWGLIFEGIVPDIYDVMGATIACTGVAIIYYFPRKGEEKLWSNH